MPLRVSLMLGLALFTAACSLPVPLPTFGGGTGDAASDASETQLVSAIAVGNTNQSQALATPAAGSAGTSKYQTVAVRRGTIAEQLTLVGRVAGQGEVAIAATSAGKVQSVMVKPGDVVSAGQVLVQMEQAQQVSKQLAAAHDNLDMAQLRLQQAQTQQSAQADTQRQDAAARAEQDRLRQQASVADAEAALRRARAEYDRVQAGPSDADRSAAQAAVAAAQSALNRAQADQARLAAGPTTDQIRGAERELAAAQTEQDKNQATLDQLLKGAPSDVVRAAERDVERAQTAQQLAEAAKGNGSAAADAAIANANLAVQDAKDRLTKVQQSKTPDAEAVRAAQRDVERAKTAQQLAESAKADPAAVAAQDAAIANAKLALQDAQDRLTKLKQPPSDQDVAIARRNVTVSNDAVKAATERLAAVRQGPDQATLDAADSAVQSAQLNLDIAQAKVDELSRHPTPAELRDALANVTDAQQALQRAQTGQVTPPQDLTVASDTTLLAKAVEQAGAQVEDLESQLAVARILAPSGGTISSVAVRSGDALDAGQVVLQLAQAGAPLVRADITDVQAAQLTLQQAVTAQLDGIPGPPLKASLIDVTGAAGSGKTAQFRVDWADPPAFGASIQIMVSVREKSDVLLVPKKAVHSAGARKYVEYMNGSSRRRANVEVGIVGADDTEIVSGLEEGQLVLVR